MKIPEEFRTEELSAWRARLVHRSLLACALSLLSSACSLVALHNPALQTSLN